MQLLFVPLIFAVLHKKQAGNARVTVAAMGMTWFFNQTHLQYSLAFVPALGPHSESELLSPSGLILTLFPSEISFLY